MSRVGIAAIIASFAFPVFVRAAQLEVDDLFVNYATQTATDATGTISFSLRFSSLDGDPGGYDLVTTQVLLARMGIGSPAKFSLDESDTENTAAIGASYWLPSPPTLFQNASTIGDEFRFSDFVSMTQAYTPDAGDVVARFFVNFTVDSVDEFGSYEIVRGDATHNFFGRDLTETVANEFDNAEFTLVPIPEPATVLPLVVGLCVLRRRR